MGILLNYIVVLTNITHHKGRNLSHFLGNRKCFIGVKSSGCMTYKMTPRDHKSAVWLYGCSRTNSGAMYKGVPCMNLKPNQSEAIKQEVSLNCKHNSNVSIVSFVLIGLTFYGPQDYSVCRHCTSKTKIT